VETQLYPVPDAWWAPYREKGWLRHFRPEAASWQQHEIHKLIREHGIDRFSGLDLHGMA
jgi:hypothetical protein